MPGASIPRVRVEWIIPALKVEIRDGLVNLTGGGIDSLRPKVVPGPIKVAFAVRLAGLPSQHDHSLGVTVLGPDMRPLTKPLTATFKLTEAPHGAEGWEVVHHLCMTVEATVHSYDPITVTMATDDTSKSVVMKILRDAG